MRCLVRGVVLSALAAGSAACATTVDPDPRTVPLEEVRPGRREAVRRILEGGPLEVVLPLTRVRSTLDLFDFLMEELPFTAGVLRALGMAEYDIYRESPRPGDWPEERERRLHTYHLNDGHGMELAAELIYHEPGKWVYYVWGQYTFLFTIEGRSVIVVTAHPRGGVLETEAHVFVPEMKVPALLLEGIVRDKSMIFIDAATTVSEAAARDPEGLVRNVRGSPEVDEAVLKRFEEIFLDR